MEHRSNDLAIEAKWSTGQRTPLWDAFWHRVMADIAPGGHVGGPVEALAELTEDQSGC